MDGISHRGIVRPTDRWGVVAFLAAVVVTPRPASAEAPQRFEIPAGRLDDSLVLLSRQAQITIGLTDTALGASPVPPLSGRLTVPRALARLLAGSSARAERIDLRSWRIVRARADRVRRDRPLHGSSGTVPPVAVQDVISEIVVTASKRLASFATFPGSAYVVDAGDIPLSQGGEGSSALIARLPTLSSTHLGPGRNKLFIRGVADSSFNGPTQATVGQYLGDIRINYNAPDPDLSLYDIKTIEVLEGPQGTLYGAGSLGGIIRIVPEPVVLGHYEAMASAGYSVAARGQDGSDVAGTVNAPLLKDIIGIRAVAFRSIEGGYIDDVGRGLSNVNRTTESGGRLAIKIAPGNDWSIELGGAIQNITTADGQYAERGLPKLSRSSVVAQPFDNDYLLGSVTVTKDWGDIKFVSASGVVHHDVGSTFDFSPNVDEPTVFKQHNRIWLLTSENHLSRRDRNGVGWVIGLNVVHDEERLTRSLGPPNDTVRILGVGNAATLGAAYAEGSLPVTRRLIASFGGRLEVARLIGEALNGESDTIPDPRRTETTFLPSASLSWRGNGQTTLYVRYQEGVRPGGLSVGGANGTGSVQRFRGDSLALTEIGLRYGDPSKSRFDASTSLSYARWENIQADLIDVAGLPLTANIGSGRIWSFEARGRWRPVDGLRLEATLFANDSRLTDPTATFRRNEAPELPNIPHFGARAAIDYATVVLSALTLDGNFSLRYVGGSRLGVDTSLDLPQGNYLEANAGLRIGTSRYGFSIDASNLLDNVANRFALGDPFDVAEGRQLVPLRPRTIRFGLDARF